MHQPMWANSKKNTVRFPSQEILPLLICLQGLGWMFPPCVNINITPGLNVWSCEIGCKPCFHLPAISASIGNKRFETSRPSWWKPRHTFSISYQRVHVPSATQCTLRHTAPATLVAFRASPCHRKVTKRVLKTVERCLSMHLPKWCGSNNSQQPFWNAYRRHCLPSMSKMSYKRFLFPSSEQLTKVLIDICVGNYTHTILYPVILGVSMFFLLSHDMNPYEATSKYSMG